MEPTKTNSDTSKSSAQFSSSGRFANKKLLVYILSFAIIGGAILLIKSFAAGLPYKDLSFSSDPQWESVNATPGATACTTRNSNFGWDDRKLTPGGVVGGTISSSSTYREYYAKDLGGTKNLSDNLSASGQISLDRTNKNGFLLGWFNKTYSNGYYPRAFMGLEYDGQNFNMVLSSHDNMLEKISLPVPTIKVIGKSKQSKYSTYNYSIVYNPAASGHGQISLKIESKTVTKDLRTDTITDGASFTNFGLLNVMNDAAGTSGPVYIDNLVLNGGAAQEFTTDPGWDTANNHLNAANDCEVRSRNNYGWFNTNNAGGTAGEIGGLSWHTGTPSHYADTTDNVSLANRFYATGKLDLKNASNSGKAYFGWFNSGNANASETALRNVLAIQLAGSPEAGYRLAPVYRDSTGGGQQYGSGWGDIKNAPSIPNGTVTNWSMCYEPNVNAAGAGRLTYIVGSKKLSLDLPVGTKGRSSQFNRFGLFVPAGNTGNYMNYFMDDLRYTTANGDSGPADFCGPVDTVAPTVNFTAPAASSYVSGSNYMVKVDATDNLAVSGVQFQLDGKPLGAEDISSPFEVSWDTTKSTEGIHKLSAVARDGMGNKTTATVSTTVDNSAPKVSLTKPLANEEVSGNAVALSATASDTVKLAGVQFKLDSVNLGTELTTSPFNMTWDSNTVVDGPHKLTAVARDAAGNTTTTDIRNFVVHNDKTAPVVSITAPENGSFIKGSSLKLSADATDNKAVTGVQFLLDSKSFKDEDMAAPYELSLDLSSISEDQHTVSAVARDGWGNKTTADKVTFTFDNTAPNIRIFSPRNTAKVHGVFYIRVAADDENGVVGVQFYIDGHKVKGEDKVEPFQIKWDSRTVDNGRHTITAIARDAAGNATTATRVKVTVAN